MSDHQTPQKTATPWSAAVFTIVAGVALGIVIAVALEYRHYFGTAVSPLSSEWNNFGTFFGGLLGPILSMLAFFALVYTIFLQEQQLTLARATLKAADEDKALTRKQLDAAIETQRQTSDALQHQNQLASEQSVKTMFFELVTLHNQIVRDISYDEQTEAVVTLPNRDIPSVVPAYNRLEGRKALDFLFDKRLRQQYDQARQLDQQNQQSGMRPIREFDYIMFKRFYASYLSDIGQYFRNLYRIFKFIDESKLSVEDKRTLAGLIKAQLSNSELGLLFYNGKSELGEKFKPLMERYKLFENMTMGTPFIAESVRDYDVSAFGDSVDKFFTYVGIPQPDPPEKS